MSHFKRCTGLPSGINFLHRKSPGKLFFFFSQKPLPLVPCGLYNRAQRHPFVPVLKTLMSAPCRHQQVRFVSREEDAEFVECVNCGEVFDAAELRDIAAEEDSESTSEDASDEAS